MTKKLKQKVQDLENKVRCWEDKWNDLRMKFQLLIMGMGIVAFLVSGMAISVHWGQQSWLAFMLGAGIWTLTLFALVALND